LFHRSARLRTQEFDPKRTLGRKIDYVLVMPATRVVESWIDRRSKDGRAPSDHFPVGAVVEFVGRSEGGSGKSEPAK
jgi:endonuclease/exonuclease/phosphatase family metal-dependent hydrolase